MTPPFLKLRRYGNEHLKIFFKWKVRIEKPESGIRRKYRDRARDRNLGVIVVWMVRKALRGGGSIEGVEALWGLGGELKLGRERSWGRDTQATPTFRSRKNERRRSKQRKQRRRARKNVPDAEWRKLCKGLMGQLWQVLLRIGEDEAWEFAMRFETWWPLMTVTRMFSSDGCGHKLDWIGVWGGKWEERKWV